MYYLRKKGAERKSNLYLTLPKGKGKNPACSLARRFEAKKNFQFLLDFLAAKNI
jgi:hypothetical protein